MSRRSDRTAGVEAEEVARPFLPWLGRACRQAREDRGVVQVKIAAAIEVNQATIARFEDGSAWPRRPEQVLMAYASRARSRHAAALGSGAGDVVRSTSRSWTQRARSGSGSALGRLEI